MASLFRRFVDWLRRLFFKQEMDITLVGLQNAGKTTLVHVMGSGEFQEDMIPTVGFNMRKVSKGRVSMKMWDVGGQTKFRSMWERYCRGVSSIVFVVDAADDQSFSSAREELQSLVSKPGLAGIPLLVLANKQDIPSAQDAEGVASELRLELIEGREVACYGTSAKVGTHIDTVLQWLMQHSKKKN